jgi:hypothetical protein
VLVGQLLKGSVSLVRGGIAARRAFWREGFAIYGSAFRSFIRSPKEAILKTALVVPLAFAVYVLLGHWSASAFTPATPATCTSAALASSYSPGGVSSAWSSLAGGGTTGFSSWMGNAIGVVRALFIALLGLQIVQDVVEYYLQTSGHGSIAGFFGAYARVMLINLAMVGIFISLPALALDFFSSAGAAGIAVSGAAAQPYASNIFSGFQPGIISDMGDCLADTMTTSLANNTAKVHYSWTNIGQDIQNAMQYITAWFEIRIVGSSMVQLAFLVIAIIYMFVALEVFFVAGLGLLTGAGLGHRAFYSLPLSFLGTAFGLFMKIASLGALSGMGVNLSGDWQTSLLAADTLAKLSHEASSIGWQAFGFMILAGFLPLVIGKHFGGSALGSAAGSALGSAAGQAAGAATKGGSGGGGGASRSGNNSSPSSNNSNSPSPSNSSRTAESSVRPPPSGAPGGATVPTVRNAGAAAQTGASTAGAEAKKTASTVVSSIPK